MMRLQHLGLFLTANYETLDLNVRQYFNYFYKNKIKVDSTYKFGTTPQCHLFCHPQSIVFLFFGMSSHDFKMSTKAQIYPHTTVFKSGR